MKINPTEKLGNFVSYLDEDGLTEKAYRTKVLQIFIDKINAKIHNILTGIDFRLITDPAVIISPNFYNKIDVIINDSVDHWNKIHFPTKDTMLIRTSSFDAKYYFPHMETSLSQDISKVIDDVKRFLEQEKPRQIVLHPRIASDVATKQLYALRAKSIPADTHIQIGKGGQRHINKLENADQHYEFDYLKQPEGLPKDFIIFSRALSIITPVADAIYLQMDKKSKSLPVYEFKGLITDDGYVLNMLDYEI